jgi:DNA-binding transcriptional LysR family regulator
MLALDAAVDGQGVALAPLYLADRELREGRVALVAARSLEIGEAVFLAWPAPGVRRLSASAAVLRDWLLSQARATQAQLQRFLRE